MSARALYRRRLIILFLLIKAALVAIAAVVVTFVQPYSASTGLLLASYPPSSRADELVRRALAPFARWDALYFLQIAMEGYQFEHQHAFYPALPALLRCTAQLLMAPLARWLSLPSRLLIAGVVISNACHLGTMLNIFK